MQTFRGNLSCLLSALQVDPVVSPKLSYLPTSLQGVTAQETQRCGIKYIKTADMEISVCFILNEVAVYLVNRVAQSV
jgi:hypothetical protein